MITDFVMPIFRESGVNGFWFQKGDAVCHTARQTIYLLRPLLPRRAIWKNYDIDRPLRSLGFTLVGTEIAAL